MIGVELWASCEQPRQRVTQFLTLSDTIAKYSSWTERFARLNHTRQFYCKRVSKSTHASPSLSSPPLRLMEGSDRRSVFGFDDVFDDVFADGVMGGVAVAVRGRR